MKQLTPYAVGSRTQIFKNIYKAASLSCYIVLTKKILEFLNKTPPSLIKIPQAFELIPSSFWKNQNDIFSVEKMCHLKFYITELVRMTNSKLNILG